MGYIESIAAGELMSGHNSVFCLQSPPVLPGTKEVKDSANPLYYLGQLVLAELPRVGLVALTLKKPLNLCARWWIVPWF